MNKYALLLFGAFISLKVSASSIEEIVVTSGRSDGAPVVLSIKADYHFQPIRILNDSLVGEERARDVRLVYTEIVAASLKSENITLVNSDLTPILSDKGFSKKYQDRKSNNMGYIDLSIKSEVKNHDPKKGTYKKQYSDFINGIGKVERTKIQFSGSSDITIVNPRNYRKKLINEIGSDIQNLTKSLGGDYRAIINGLDGELRWHREGEDNVEFYIPYEFFIIPTNISSMPELR